MAQDYRSGYNIYNLKSILNFHGKIKKTSLDANLIKIFDFFDTDKSGELDREELNNLLGQVSSYGASKDKSIFDNDEVIQFIKTYKNKSNQTLKQLDITNEDLYKFLDKIKSSVSVQTKIKQNLKMVGIGNTYRNLALWLCRQEQKNPSEAEVLKKEKELKW